MMSSDIRDSSLASIPFDVGGRLLLFTESLSVRLAIRMKELFAAFLPRRFEFGCGDVPVRTAFDGHSTEILPELFDRWAAEEPIAVVDLVDY